MNILANDGISQSGIEALEANGFNVITTNVAQEQLINFINENDIVASFGTVVRPQLRKDLIDACPRLKNHRPRRCGYGQYRCGLRLARKRLAGHQYSCCFLCFRCRAGLCSSLEWSALSCTIVTQYAAGRGKRILKA